MLALLIHGAYTSPWHWHRLVPVLESAGCEVIVPELPCDDPDAGLETYLAAVEAEIGEQSEPPVVVGSSFGAVTACAFAARHEVRALMTVCGMVPLPRRPISEDAAQATQPAFATAVDVNEDGSTTFRPDAALEIVFHESEPELAREAASRLRNQAARPFLEPAPFEGLPDVPRRGIVAPEDRLLRPEWLASVVRERLGVEPMPLAGDHTPMLSQPERLAELLLAGVT